MGVLKADAAPGPTENWDDDFEFEAHNSNNERIRRLVNESDSSPLSKDTKNKVKSDTSLLYWAEPGPSTPSRRTATQTENWDDDFQDKSDSPLRPRVIGTSPRSRKTPRRSVPEPENWDDDFEDAKAVVSKPRPTHWDSLSSSDEELGFADREEDRTVTSRSRRSGIPSVQPHETPPPPVPPIPTSLLGTDRHDPGPFPRSPATSVFSVPASGRDSVAGYSYSSTAHLALRPTLTGSSLGALPPSPPTYHARERRRLRKKSRPPRLDDNIIELDDRAEATHPVTPDRPTSSLDEVSSDNPPIDATPSQTGKTSLVSRIGSVGKKFGAVRKKRASTGPLDINMSHVRDQSQTPRPTSMASPASAPSGSRSGWFFRHGGDPGVGSASPPSNSSALPLRHEKSVDRLLSLVGFDPETPSKRKQKVRRGLPAELSSDANGISSSLLFGTTRRPASMQVSMPPPSARPVNGPRHASYGHHRGRNTPSSRSSSMPRSASASVEDLVRRESSRLKHQHSQNSVEKEQGNRGFMDGIRRMNLNKRHMRSKSSIVCMDDREYDRIDIPTLIAPIHPLPERGDDATPRPPSRIKPRPSADNSLLPPIELQPPSPPRTLSGPSDPLSSLSPHLPEIDSPLGLPNLVFQPHEKSCSSQDIPPPSSCPKDPTTISSPTTSPGPAKGPVSPQQSASLGRSTQLSKDAEPGAGMLRRNSLGDFKIGDLKIPARISQAQTGLRRDLGMVREFATSIEQLRELQVAYNSLVSEVGSLLIEMMPPEDIKPIAVSPTLFGFPRRQRSSTNPTPPSSDNQAVNFEQLSAAYRALELKYRISWECTELLIELGGGPPASQPRETSRVLAIAERTPSFGEGRKSRERAITLAGDESKPSTFAVPMGSPPISSISSQWRASTGRHDLSQRQLILLREMLNPESSNGTALEQHIQEEEADRTWRWGDGMSSTLTLPSEDSSQHDPNPGAGRVSPVRRRKSGRLGMRGLRDMLKSLKKSMQHQHPQVTSTSSPRMPPPPLPSSATAIAASTQSSLHLPREPQSRPQSSLQRRRAKTSVGPESINSVHEANSPYIIAESLSHKTSPRRPSLASIFRLGQKSRSSNTASSPHSSFGRELSVEDVRQGPRSSSGHITPSTEEEDWDRVESSEDLGLSAKAPKTTLEGSATVRGKKSYSPYSLYHQLSKDGIQTVSRKTPNPSQSSIWGVDLQQLPGCSPVQSSPLTSPSSITLPFARTPKLSDVREHGEKDTGAIPQRPGPQRSLSKGKRQASGNLSPNLKRPPSRDSRRGAHPGSVRSALPQTWATVGHVHGAELNSAILPDGRLALAMTPENIKPLLENAREVHSRCTECIVELRYLLASQRPVD